MNFKQEHAIETYRSLINIANQAFKGLQFLNGGAVVALLAYFGQVSTASDTLLRAKFPMALFVAGLVASTLAFFTAYLTQLALHNENIEQPTFMGLKHVIWLQVTFIICIVSVGFFAWGAFACINVLTGSAATIE